jgi:hypothetical protein
MTRAAQRRRVWEELVGGACKVFTAPGAALFCTMVTGWVLAPGRRTVTAMIAAGDPLSRRAHDAYHRFFRAARWSPAELWEVLAVHAVGLLCPRGVVTLDLDDTLYKKSGRKVEGAGIFRDAVRSTRNKVVYALGLNLVVVTLRVEPPWGGMPIGVPVGVRLHRKDGPKTTELAEQVVRELAGWLPGRSFLLCADGAYACLAGRHLPRTTVVSRMRRDAALYEPAPPRTGKRGRPRSRGARLATPEATSKALANDRFAAVNVNWRGTSKDLLVFSRHVLWYSVDKKDLVLLVIVRDPAGVMHDDFFFTTDLGAAPADVASSYAGRWSIECVNREVKQCLGAEGPQCWKGQGPERAASLSLWLYAAIWVWYIPTIGTTPSWIPRPWYPKKQRPSFLDALASLRRCLLDERITAMSSCRKQDRKILDGLLDLLSTAA